MHIFLSCSSICLRAHFSMKLIRISTFVVKETPNYGSKDSVIEVILILWASENTLYIYTLLWMEIALPIWLPSKSRPLMALFFYILFNFQPHISLHSVFLAKRMKDWSGQNFGTYHIKHSSALCLSLQCIYIQHH